MRSNEASRKKNNGKLIYHKALSRWPPVLCTFGLLGGYLVVKMNFQENNAILNHLMKCGGWGWSCASKFLGFFIAYSKMSATKTKNSKNTTRWEKRVKRRILTVDFNPKMSAEKLSSTPSSIRLLFGANFGRVNQFRILRLLSNKFHERFPFY